MKKSALWVLSRQIVQQIGEGHIACQNVCPVIEKYYSHTFSIRAISQQTMASRAELHHKGWIPAAYRTEVRHVPPGVQEEHPLLLRFPCSRYKKGTLSKTISRLTSPILNLAQHFKLPQMPTWRWWLSPHSSQRCPQGPSSCPADL